MSYGAGVAKAAVLVLLAVGLAGSAMVLADETRLRQTQSLTTALVGGRSNQVLQAAFAACNFKCAPREELALAAALDAAARAQAKGPGRNALLGEAERALDAATVMRPDWAALWIRRADVDAAADQLPSVVLSDLQHSYASAPFLADDGKWRVLGSVSAWSDATPVLRTKVLTEAVWLMTIKPDLAPTILAGFAQSDSAATALRLKIAMDATPTKRKLAPSDVASASH